MTATYIYDAVRTPFGRAGGALSGIRPDDLAAVAMRILPPGDRGVRFIGAGGDLLIVGDASLATTISDAIKDEAADDPDFAKRVAESAARVVAMKERRGLANC